MSAITSHVLDTSLGQPAAGLEVTLASLDGQVLRELGRGETDAEGRIKDLLGRGELLPGTYRLSFEAGAYFRIDGRSSFYDRIDIQFVVTDAKRHHHVPLLLSPFGYSTYRGT